MLVICFPLRVMGSLIWETWGPILWFQQGWFFLTMYMAMDLLGSPSFHIYPGFWGSDRLKNAVDNIDAR